MVEAQRGVEQLQALGGGQRLDPGAGDPVVVTFGEVAGDPAGVAPQAPGERDSGQPTRAAVGGQRVQERVGCGVVPLAWAAENPGGRGEQHERGEIAACGEFVQVPGRVDLGAQYPVHPLWGQRFDDTVVDHASGVDDRGQGMAGGDRGEDAGEGCAVGGVAGADGDCRAEPGEFGVQLAGTGGVGTPSAGQKQMTDTVLGDQMPRERGAQRPGTTGDQYRARGLPGRPVEVFAARVTTVVGVVTVALGGGCGGGAEGGYPGQPRHVHGASADRELWFVAVAGRGQRGR